MPLLGTKLACAKALTPPSFACKCSFLCAHTIMRTKSRYIITYTYTYKNIIND